jgi:hypothetical protein
VAGLTTTKSPLHEKVCVAGTAIVGGAVGSAVPVVGTLAGAATGFIVGMLVCSRDVISKPIGDKLDFSSAINEIARNAGLQDKMIDAMVEQKIAPDRRSCAIMLSYALDEAKKNPDKYYRSSASAFMPPTGKAAHGLHDLARKSRGAAATAAS